QEIIANGNGPKLDAFRAPTANDAGIGYHNAWFKNGLYDLQHKVVGKPTIVKGKDGVTQISLTIESQGREGSQQVYSDRDRSPQTVYTFSQGKHALGADDFKFTTNQVYTIYPDGSVELQSAISANRTNVVLPRIGYSMKLPKQYNQFSYYGRGPVNNYADRKTGQFIELHQGEVGKQDIILPKPQSMGNREEVRYCALRPAQGGEGVAFVADSVMSVSALPWSQQQLTQAAHIYQLPESDGTYLHLDAKVTGLGGASCGQGGPFVEDQALSHNYNFGFIIRPLAARQQLAEVAKVSPSGEQPISIEHSRTGMVTLSSPAKGRTIMYALGGSKKATAYTAPVNLRAGGTITTWYKDNPAMKTSMTYAKVESVPLQVVFASSQEPGSGDASYLVDGDPATIWHTMYSITLAKYPHWVDFDAAEPKLMKGFTFLPRQSGQNGWVKDYEVYVSQDGKSWGEPVCKGTFAANAELKRVMFSKPVKARYIRFRALNEQNGQDFASGAEFSLIAE
uniref:discoidin domain-containing protein n=1 Tax=Prevotellamassilia timonensis TaxID=1852370 RepID=UPI003FF03935